MWTTEGPRSLTTSTAVCCAPPSGRSVAVALGPGVAVDVGVPAPESLQDTRSRENDKTSADRPARMIRGTETSFSPSRSNLSNVGCASLVAACRMVPDRRPLSVWESGLARVNVSSSSQDYRQLGDEELMRRLQYRDKVALEAIFDRYGDLVYTTALRVLRDAQLAEDVSQEIFGRLWRKPGSYVAERGRFLTWLISVTRNRAVDEVRSRGRRQRHETASPEAQERELPAGSANDPALNAQLAEAARTIRAALSGLPGEQREVIELAYFGGLTQQEISQRLAQPLGTVKTRIRLGMQKLRAALGPVMRRD